MKRLVVFGCGYSARRFVELHGAAFDAVDVSARTKESVAKLASEGFSAHHFDGSAQNKALAEAVLAASHVLISAPPGLDGDPVAPWYQRTLIAAAERSLAWIGYLSTIGVYADADGGWVDEATEPNAENDRAARRLQAEEYWLSWRDDFGVAVQIFRLAGIYGPGRSAVDNLRAGTAKRLVKPGQVFNRIHVDDIAAAIAAGVERPDVGPIVNVTDDEPAPPQDVVAYAAGLIGVPPPPEIPFETAELSPMARSFYSSNKRVANRVLREALGVRLRFPTYREGIAALAG